MWEVYDYLSMEEQIDLQRRVRAQHYGNLTLIDERIGDVLSCLKRKNLLDDTYIIFSSDHGASLFDNGLLHKGTHFDESVRVPFIIHHAENIKPNIIDQFSTHVDLYPTLVSLAGGIIPNNIEGFDLSDILLGENTGFQDFAIMECTLATSIITHKWKMSTHHIHGDSDLYDIVNDPNSLDNLFEKQGFEQIIKNLQKKIVAWRKNLSPDMDISDDLAEWRECLGPKEYIESFRNRYIKEYERLAKLNPKERPGKVGHYAQELLDRIKN
jgi:arylsulfatase A-like enzyme